MNCRSLKSDQRCGQTIDPRNDINRLFSILSRVTREIEFMAFSFSASKAGYEMRVKQRIGIIQAFSERATWNAEDNDYDIALELLDILGQHRT